MAFDYSKLKGKIIEVYGSLSAFAEDLGISIQSLSQKLKNKSKISQKEIVIWSDKLNIDSTEIHLYFFTQEVSKS